MFYRRLHLSYLKLGLYFRDYWRFVNWNYRRTNRLNNRWFSEWCGDYRWLEKRLSEDRWSRSIGKKPLNEIPVYLAARSLIQCLLQVDCPFDHILYIRFPLQLWHCFKLELACGWAVPYCFAKRQKKVEHRWPDVLYDKVPTLVNIFDNVQLHTRPCVLVETVKLEEEKQHHDVQGSHKITDIRHIAMILKRCEGEIMDNSAKLDADRIAFAWLIHFAGDSRFVESNTRHFRQLLVWGRRAIGLAHNCRKLQSKLLLTIVGLLLQGYLLQGGVVGMSVEWPDPQFCFERYVWAVSRCTFSWTIHPYRQWLERTLTSVPALQA